MPFSRFDVEFNFQYFKGKIGICNLMLIIHSGIMIISLWIFKYIWEKFYVVLPFLDVYLILQSFDLFLVQFILRIMFVKMNYIVMGQTTIGPLWCGDRIVSKSFVETKDKSFCTQYYLGESYVHQGPSLLIDPRWHVNKTFFCFVILRILFYSQLFRDYKKWDNMCNLPKSKLFEQ